MFFCLFCFVLFFLLNSIPWDRCTTVESFIFEKYLTGSTLGLLQIKFLWTFMYMFYVKISLYFSAINARNAIVMSYGNCTFSFLKNCHIVFWSVCAILLKQFEKERYEFIFSGLLLSQNTSVVFAYMINCLEKYTCFTIVFP